jgi:hypothetical protein
LNSPLRAVLIDAAVLVNLGSTSAAAELIFDLSLATANLQQLNSGQQLSLTTKLSAALDSLSRGDRTAACGQLTGYFAEIGHLLSPDALVPLFSGTGSIFIGHGEIDPPGLGPPEPDPVTTTTITIRPGPQAIQPFLGCRQ